VFIDIYSRKVIGWAMDTRIWDTLVLAALNQAIGREHPEEGLLVHTDRGAQYASQRFQTLLIRSGFRQSMSRNGNPYDNAIMESLYRTLKESLCRMPVMTTQNKLAQQYSNTLNATTPQSEFIPLLAG